MTSSTSARSLTAVLLLLTPLVASATDPPTKSEDEASLQRARDQYDHARDLAQHGQFEEARRTIEQAWTLKKHWQIAAYLAYTELKTGRYRSAAEHAAYALRHCPRDADPTQRKFVEGVQSDARARVGTVKVKGLAADANLLVDDKPVDAILQPDPVFLDAGSHWIEARRPDGTSKRRAVTAQAGQTAEVDLSPDPAVNLAANSATSSTSAAALSASSTSAKPARPGGYETSSHGWSPRTWTLVSEGALAVVALGVGTGFALRANARDNDATNARATAGSRTACRIPSSGCSDLAGAYDDRDSAARWANVGFVAGGVLGVATLATFFLWPSSRRPAAADRTYSITPTAGESSGIMVQGSF